MTKEELKQEAEELYEDWYAHKLGAISIVDVICKMAEPREKRIAELEATIRNTKAVDESFALQTIQLTKAKEIIKKYYKYSPGCEYFYEDIDKEAEQFLKDLEK